MRKTPRLGKVWGLITTITTRGNVSILANQNAIAIPELNGAKIRKTEDGRFSVYDLIRIAGGQKNPHQPWKRLQEAYPELLTKCEFYKFPGKGRNNTPVATIENCLYILGLLPGECGKSYREKAANLVRRYIEGDADLGAEIIIREHNKDRFDRAKKRLLVCETNKQTAEIALQHGVNPSFIHSDRYRGLYRKTTNQLREDAGLKKTETPLNAMSARDLTMNSLVNQLVAESGDPDLAFDFGDSIRQGFERTMKKSLQPIWEHDQIRPQQARKVLSDSQLELPFA
jgi:hypothetical protein